METPKPPEIRQIKSPEELISEHPLVVQAIRELQGVLAAAEAGLPIGHSKMQNIDVHWDDDMGGEIADAYSNLSNARLIAREELGLPPSDWGEYRD